MESMPSICKAIACLLSCIPFDENTSALTISTWSLVLLITGQTNFGLTTTQTWEDRFQHSLAISKRCVSCHFHSFRPELLGDTLLTPAVSALASHYHYRKFFDYELQLHRCHSV